MKQLQLARAPWSDAVFVCGKCVRKAGAKGFRKDLKKALKASGNMRDFHVVETGCFDLCPKKRIVVAQADALNRGRLFVSSPGGADAVVAAIAEARAKRPGGPPRGRPDLRPLQAPTAAPVINAAWV